MYIKTYRKTINFLLQLGSLRLTPIVLGSQPGRTTTTKHYNPKFKKERKGKFLKVELPNFSEDTSNMTPEKIRQKMKERGLLPPRPWMERPFYISATGICYIFYT